VTKVCVSNRWSVYLFHWYTRARPNTAIHVCMQSSAGWLVLTGEPAGGSDAVSIVTTGDPPRPGDAQRQTGRLLSGHLHLPTARVQSAQAQVYWGPPDVVTLTRTAFVMTRVECRDRASCQLTRVPSLPPRKEWYLTTM